MINLNYHQTKFVMSSPNIYKLPINNGLEVAFVGVSNAGKSSLINALCNQNNLAKTSSTAGRTQLINLFSVAPFCNLVDLPGYGYAAVPEKLKIEWQKSLGEYLEKREYLVGVVLLMDARHPLKPLDQQMLEWACSFNIPLTIALTKIDKVSQSQLSLTMRKVNEAIVRYTVALEDAESHEEVYQINVIPCSAVKKKGIDLIAKQLDTWFSAVTSKYEDLGITKIEPITDKEYLEFYSDNLENENTSQITNLNLVSRKTKGHTNKQRYSPTARRLGTSKPFVDPKKLQNKDLKNNHTAKSKKPNNKVIKTGKSKIDYRRKKYV